MEPSLPILSSISKEVAKEATTEGLALEETLVTPIEITLLAVEERIMAEITTAMVEEVVKSVTITILETTMTTEEAWTTKAGSLSQATPSILEMEAV
jgi:hypothetical protein